MAKITTIVILISIAFFACKKPSERTCLKSVGDDKTMKISYDFSNIDTLLLNDGITYYLLQGNDEKIEITTGENLINLIDINVLDGTLTISDNNKCKFLRSYNDEITVRITISDFKKLTYTGFETLITPKKITLDELRVFQREGAGEMNLDIEAGYLSVTIASGYGNFNLKGNALGAYLLCNGNGYCDSRNFSVDGSLNVASRTQADMIINANNSNFTATIHQYGNIKYFGEPETIIVNSLGGGQVIAAN